MSTSYIYIHTTYIYTYIYRERRVKEGRNYWLIVTFIAETTSFELIHRSLSSLTFNRTEADINKLRYQKEKNVTLLIK